MRERAAAVILRGGKVLFMRRVKNGEEYYTIPGGTVDPGETPEAAAVREIDEEFGMKITLGPLLFVTEEAGAKAYHFLAATAVGEPVLGGIERAIMAPANQFHPAWVAYEDIPGLAKVYPEGVREELIRVVSSHPCP